MGSVTSDVRLLVVLIFLDTEFLVARDIYFVNDYMTVRLVILAQFSECDEGHSECTGYRAES